MKFTFEEVGLYLEGVGIRQRPDAHGRVRIPCPFPLQASPPHDLLMDAKTGLWTDQGPHGRGDLVDFEQGRSRIFDNRAAENAVLRIIRETRESQRRAEEARKAARDKQVDDLPGRVRSLRRSIDRHPEGIARRDLQQGSHMRSGEFRKGLKELERRGLIRSQRVPGRLRRGPKVIYFPVATSEPVSDTKTT
jgi:hypothetical protein